MKYVLLALSVLAVGLSMQAIAEDIHDNEVVAEHYAVAVPASTDAALQLLKDKTSAVSDVLARGEELEASDLEDVHEISYSLEAAIDKIIQEKAIPAAVSAGIDEAIQAIHFASENHKENVVREFFAKLKASVGELEGQKDAKEKSGAPTLQNEYVVIIKDHKFSPEEIIIPAGQKIKLIVDNQDPTPEEFESHDMNREKIIGGNKKATIRIGPLKPGKYHFFGEFNEDTANGYIIAK